MLKTTLRCVRSCGVHVTEVLTLFNTQNFTKQTVTAVSTFYFNLGNRPT